MRYYSINKMQILNCSDYKKNHTIVSDPQSGEMICNHCGIILDNIENAKLKWDDDSTFNHEEMNYRSRTGAPTSLARHDMGLATVIGGTDRDASGNMLNTQMRSTMNRLRLWDFRTRAHSTTDRNLRSAFSELDKLKDKLGLPDAAIEKTAYIYRKAQENGLVRGRTIPAVLAAAAYVVCREMGMSRTLDDISKNSNIQYKELARTYRLLVIDLDLKVPLIDPIKYISKIANKMGLREITKRRAIGIMHEVIKNEISAGKDPMGLAAAVLYLASLSAGNQSIRQLNIADAAGITEVTLRNRLKDLRSKLQILN